MNGLALAIILLAVAVIVLGVRDLRRRSFDRHCDDALRLGAQDRHPAGQNVSTRPGDGPGRATTQKG